MLKHTTFSKHLTTYFVFEYIISLRNSEINK